MAKVKKKYQKPEIIKEKSMNFPIDIILLSGRKIACRQCSGCHGCR